MVHETASPLQDRRHARPRFQRRGDASTTLWRAGADVFRINMSHADPWPPARARRDDPRGRERVGRPIGVLVDLQGPKLRVGLFAERRRRSARGPAFRLRLRSDARRRDARAPAPSGNSRRLAAGPCAADRRRQGAAACRRGLARKRAVAIGRMSPAASPTARASACPTPKFPSPAMTAKDRADLEAALETGVDWIALSFVQRAEDVAEVKKIVAGRALVWPRSRSRRRSPGSTKSWRSPTG